MAATRLRLQAHPSVYVLIIAGHVLYVFGRWTPQPFERTGATRETLAWLASLTEALQFHWAVLLVIVLAAYCAIARVLHPLLLVTPLLAWLVIAPTLHGATADHVTGMAFLRAQTTRITSANLLVGNHENARDVVRELTGPGPDVIVLQEYSFDWDDALRPRLEARGFRLIDSERRNDSFGLAVYVRPKVEADARRLVIGGGEAPQFRIELRHRRNSFALYAIHTLPPLSRSYSIDGRHEFGELLERVESDDGPTMLVGDFNSTRDSAQFRAFEQRGYVDAWELRGSGRGATWLPAAIPAVFPGLVLDHAYVSDELMIGRVSRGARNGSDHRPLTVDVRVRDGAS